MDKAPSAARSSYLVSPIALSVNFILCVLAAVWGYRLVSAALLLLFLLALGARLWSRASAKKLSVRVRSAVTGVFPGETVEITTEIRNGKFLPVPWLEMFIPLPENLCLLPPEDRAAAEWEETALRASGASAERVGEKKFGFCAWYETLTDVSLWTAKRRGLCTLDSWRLRTGDGLGLSQTEVSLPRTDRLSLAVYPALTEVTTDPFLRPMQSADTGPRGLTEDPTVIRSTREYTPSDSARAINWRLLSRGLPLSVNVYETIRPRALLFLFDGESFFNREEEMEEALSIFASELTLLLTLGVRCSMAMSRGKRPLPGLFVPENEEEALRLLAAYEPLWGDAPSPAHFDEDAVLRAVSGVGHVYWIACGADGETASSLLSRLVPGTVTRLTWEESANGTDALSLRSLRKGGTP